MSTRCFTVLCFALALFSVLPCVSGGTDTKVNDRTIERVSAITTSYPIDNLLHYFHPLRLSNYEHIQYILRTLMRTYKTGKGDISISWRHALRYNCIVKVVGFRGRCLRCESLERGLLTFLTTLFAEHQQTHPPHQGCPISNGTRAFCLLRLSRFFSDTVYAVRDGYGRASH